MNKDYSIFNYTFLKVLSDAFSKNPSEDGKLALSVYDKCVKSIRKVDYESEKYCKENAVFEVLYKNGYSPK